MLQPTLPADELTGVVPLANPEVAEIGQNRCNPCLISKTPNLAIHFSFVPQFHIRPTKTVYTSDIRKYLMVYTSVVSNFSERLQFLFGLYRNTWFGQKLQIGDKSVASERIEHFYGA